LAAVTRARDLGLAEATFFGDPRLAGEAARRIGADIEGGCRFVPTRGEADTVAQSAACVHEGRADVLVKGLVPTSGLIRAVLHHELGLRSHRLLSHVGVFNDPVSGRLLLITDAGINIAPNVDRKVRIVRNAVAVARVLGIAEPRVAMLAAVDALNYPAMQATLDAALVARIAASGAIPGAIVEGPFALDNAVSPAAAQRKNRGGRVAGRADILCGPEIETANVLYKALQIFCGATFASVVVGASRPIAVPSRADSADTKLMSIALACLLSDA
jgi:phosphate butyryltransferase